jgi:hypothetical protein
VYRDRGRCPWQRCGAYRICGFSPIGPARNPVAALKRVSYVYSNLPRRNRSFAVAALKRVPHVYSNLPRRNRSFAVAALKRVSYVYSNLPSPQPLLCSRGSGTGAARFQQPAQTQPLCSRGSVIGAACLLSRDRKGVVSCRYPEARGDPRASEVNSYASSTVTTPLYCCSGPRVGGGVPGGRIGRGRSTRQVTAPAASRCVREMRRSPSTRYCRWT